MIYDQTSSGLWVPQMMDVSTPRPARAANPRTGMGTRNDRSLGSYFVPTRMERQTAEAVYQMSWAAGKMVDIPVDDMFIRGRKWTTDDEEAIEKIMESEKDLMLMVCLADAIRIARIYGTGMIIICTGDEGQYEAPLDWENVKEGDIINFWVVDRWSVQVKNWQTRPSKPGFGKPYQYYVHHRLQGLPENVTAPTEQVGNQYTIHESRIVRFDAIRAPQTEGWIHGPFEREWGISLITRAIDDIMRDVDMSSGVGHLMEESSVWVNKIQGWKEALMGRAPRGDPSPEDLAQNSSVLRSLWRTQFVDKEDDVERINVTFAGIADVLDRQAQRLAAIADIPVTRFMSQSPAGMNATGESDANNYAMNVQANQVRVADPALRTLDRVVAKHVGLDEPLEYEWLSLLDLSEKDQAEASKFRTESILMALEKGGIDEKEARELLAMDEYAFMPLDLENWEPPEPPEDPAITVAKIKQETEKGRPKPAARPNG